MGSRILSLLAVLVLVAGCSSTPKDTGSLSTDGSLTPAESTHLTDITGTEMTQGATPGTQQDLVVNVGDRVFFGYDKYDLSPEARATAEKQAMWLKKYPHLNISIEGHCDERGTREYNLALGEKRAMTLRNYLIALGVESGRIQTISYGKERPAVTGSDETSWAQNRRGVVVVQ
ncbi:MAG: peptidoglycan-associated lipoprotein Pal [Proteobacteria bacterium]|nr:peptidoglycan-associated lipoprotein Pal [Pseudomonadota bacterium]